MIDAKMMLTIEKIERRLEEIEKVVRELNQAIEDYLQWMAESGYTKATRQAYLHRWPGSFLCAPVCL